MRCPAAEARDAAARPADCAPVLATLPKPAIAPLAPPPAAAEPAWNADFALPAADVAARAPLPASLAAAGACARQRPPRRPRPSRQHRQPLPFRPRRRRHRPSRPRRAGAPDTRPVAMPGPKIPSASKVSEASMMTSAWSMFGSGWTWNCANRPEPMPTITASTSTLMPAATTLPSTFSARKLVLFHSANGTSTNPASVVSLNSISVMKSWIASTKKHSTTTSHARNITTMGSRLANTSGSPPSRRSAPESAPRRRCRSWRAGPAARSSPS